MSPNFTKLPNPGGGVCSPPPHPCLECLSIAYWGMFTKERVAEGWLQGSLLHRCIFRFRLVVVALFQPIRGGISLLICDVIAWDLPERWHGVGSSLCRNSGMKWSNYGTIHVYLAVQYVAVFVVYLPQCARDVTFQEKGELFTPCDTGKLSKWRSWKSATICV